MSRSGYLDDLDQWALICWRGAVASAIRGARGQRMLRDLVAALDAMPTKRLIRDALQDGDEICALGALGVARGVPMDGLDGYDYEEVARVFGVAEALAREVMCVNDEHFMPETAEQRWSRVRRWAESKLRSAPQTPEGA